MNCFDEDSDHMGGERWVHQENPIGTVISALPCELSPLCGFNLTQNQEKSDCLEEW